ncbi:hypothetical protein KHC23_04300 [Ancylobacter dichloromethanicus]|uniref:hypothetical protein n=1 Tax=Ancylobacter dichloromethanicus TaxID=518825 RepID=UPI001BCA9E11|nr:hypothetical protein [Ancylobacter dichloromethanicus]MBS7552876.1 hypothetical protein [Ancylobacter dichloromethanicus]
MATQEGVTAFLVVVAAAVIEAIRSVRRPPQRTRAIAAVLSRTSPVGDIVEMPRAARPWHLS